jgi:hypothetical protein
MEFIEIGTEIFNKDVIRYIQITESELKFEVYVTFGSMFETSSFEYSFVEKEEFEEELQKIKDVILCTK